LGAGQFVGIMTGWFSAAIWLWYCSVEPPIRLGFAADQIDDMQIAGSQLVENVTKVGLSAFTHWHTAWDGLAASI
jgi:hypothetical protein